jgi:hypothetical protein
MPESSYTIEEVNGNQVVRITASKEFWSRSNYLVIQVD